MLGMARGSGIRGISAALECSLDNAAFAPCSSPAAATLAIGSHSFRVRARDAAGNLSATANRTVTIKKKKKKGKKR